MRKGRREKNIPVKAKKKIKYVNFIEMFFIYSTYTFIYLVLRQQT